MADKQYGYESGYGSGSPSDSSNTQPQQYGYESGYSGNAQEVNPKVEALKASISAASQLAPWNQVNQAYKDAVGYGAEKAGQYTNIDPKAIAAVATPIAIAPEILSAYTGLKGLYNSPSPTVQGLVNTPQELSPQYAAQNTAIGISNDVPETASKLVNPDPYQYPSQISKVKPTKFMNGVAGPLQETGQTIPRMKPQIQAEALPSTTPLKYPDDAGTLINHINDRIDTHGINLNPQELNDYKELLSTKMANGDIPKFDTNGKITPIFAKATKAAQNVTGTLNQVAEPLLQNAQLPEGTLPTRQGLNQAYGIASKQQAIQNFIKKYAVKGAEAGLGVLGTKQLYDYFRK